MKSLFLFISVSLAVPAFGEMTNPRTVCGLMSVWLNACNASGNFGFGPSIMSYSGKRSLTIQVTRDVCESMSQQRSAFYCVNVANQTWTLGNKSWKTVVAIGPFVKDEAKSQAYQAKDDRDYSSCSGTYRRTYFNFCVGK